MPKKRILAGIVTAPIWLLAGAIIIPCTLILGFVEIFVALVEYTFTGRWDPWWRD